MDWHLPITCAGVSKSFLNKGNHFSVLGGNYLPMSTGKTTLSRIHRFASPSFPSAVAAAVRVPATNSLAPRNRLFLIRHLRNQMPRTVRTVCKLRAKLWEIAWDPLLQESISRFPGSHFFSSQSFPYLIPCLTVSKADLHLQEVFMCTVENKPKRDTHPSAGALYLTWAPSGSKKNLCVPSPHWQNECNHTVSVV